MCVCVKERETVREREKERERERVRERERERESSRYNPKRVASIIINLRILPFVVEIIQYFLEGFPIQNVILSFYAIALPPPTVIFLPLLPATGCLL